MSEKICVCVPSTLSLIDRQTVIKSLNCLNKYKLDLVCSTSVALVCQHLQSEKGRNLLVEFNGFVRFLIVETNDCRSCVSVVLVSSPLDSRLHELQEDTKDSSQDDDSSLEEKDEIKSTDIPTQTSWSWSVSVTLEKVMSSKHPTNGDGHNLCRSCRSKPVILSASSLQANDSSLLADLCNDLTQQVDVDDLIASSSRTVPVQREASLVSDMSCTSCEEMLCTDSDSLLSRLSTEALNSFIQSTLTVSEDAQQSPEHTSTSVQHCLFWSPVDLSESDRIQIEGVIGLSDETSTSWLSTDDLHRGLKAISLRDTSRGLNVPAVESVSIQPSLRLRVDECASLVQRDPVGIAVVRDWIDGTRLTIDEELSVAWVLGNQGESSSPPSKRYLVDLMLSDADCTLRSLRNNDRVASGRLDVRVVDQRGERLPSDVLSASIALETAGDEWFVLAVQRDRQTCGGALVVLDSFKMERNVHFPTAVISLSLAERTGRVGVRLRRVLTDREDTLRLQREKAHSRIVQDQTLGGGRKSSRVRDETSRQSRQAAQQKAYDAALRQQLWSLVTVLTALLYIGAMVLWILGTGERQVLTQYSQHVFTKVSSSNSASVYLRMFGQHPSASLLASHQAAGRRSTSASMGSELTCSSSIGG